MVSNKNLMMLSSLNLGDGIGDGIKLNLFQRCLFHTRLLGGPVF